MGRKKDKKDKKQKNSKSSVSMPFVSICTPTFNRRPFIENMFQCFRHQTYPKSRLEWIIIDDGSDKIEDLIEKSDIPQIKYFKYDEKMTLGKKRNLMHEKTKGSIIVYMDDDDYYPPTRVEHAVNMLQANPKALCAGSSVIHVHFKHINKIVEFGPYGPNHGTAGTFAFRRTLLDQSCYDNEACLAEEKKFLKNYTVPFVQLNPRETILVFSHEHNTFDKRKLLDNPNPKVTKFTEYEVNEFIKDENMYKFFMEDIDGKLKTYEPGQPKHKPDVLKQTKEIQAEREKLQRNHIEHMEIQSKRLTISDKKTNLQREATYGEVVHIYEHTNKQLEELNKNYKTLQNEITQLQAKYDASVIKYKMLEDDHKKLLESNEEMLNESITLKAQLLSIKPTQYPEKSTLNNVASN